MQNFVHTARENQVQLHEITTNWCFFPLYLIVLVRTKTKASRLINIRDYVLHRSPKKENKQCL